VGPVEACPTDVRVAVFLLSSDQAPFEHIRLEDDPLHVALAALFMREQVLIPVVDLEFSTDQLEGLPDDIRSLARQLFVPIDWTDMAQGTQTLLKHLRDVEANTVSSVIRQYLKTTILETETFPDPCTQEDIHTETQCVPLKLVTVKELQHSRVNTTKVCDVSDMMILRRRDGLGDTVGFGNSDLLSTLGEQLTKEADVHFADARADQADQQDDMLIAAVIVGPAACGKTTLLNRTVCGYAKDALRGSPGSMVPYVIRVMALSRWLIKNQKELCQEVLFEYILADRCAGETAGLYHELFELFGLGKLALVFDGLDEAGQKLQTIATCLS